MVKSTAQMDSGSIRKRSRMALVCALLSLQGLSVGDASGQLFFQLSPELIPKRALPPGPWRWTDDTQMALSIVEVLNKYDQIDQDALAKTFAPQNKEEPTRGYGAGSHRILSQISLDHHWREVAPKQFDGGSYGNGAAMCAATINGFYSGYLDRTMYEARLSAEVTHTHLDGQAGAIVVAIAASIASHEDHPSGVKFLKKVLEYIPKSLTRLGIELALEIPANDFDSVVQRSGIGEAISAQDRVPFSLWCAAYNLDDFEAAMWQTVAGLGDSDTTCAIVGGIVALSSGEVPEEWVQRREPLVW